MWETDSTDKLILTLVAVCGLIVFLAGFDACTIISRDSYIHKEKIACIHKGVLVAECLEALRVSRQSRPFDALDDLDEFFWDEVFPTPDWATPERIDI